MYNCLPGIEGNTWREKSEPPALGRLTHGTLKEEEKREFRLHWEGEEDWRGGERAPVSQVYGTMGRMEMVKEWATGRSGRQMPGMCNSTLLIRFARTEKENAPPHTVGTDHYW
jgi:hypothetical protein